jgi:hypothetical protein
VSIAQLEIRFNLSQGTIWDIVHECLSYRKVCSGWVPHQLTDEHIKTRMESSLMLLQHYEEQGEAFLSRIVTGDETWVFHYTPQSKAESMTWKHPHSLVKNKFKTVQSPGNVMATVFWDVHGVLLVDFTLPGSTINAAAYQETQGGYSVQDSRIVPQRTRSSSFARQCSTSQCCRNHKSLELQGLGKSSTSNIQS